MISDKLVLLCWVQQLDKEGILPVHNFQRLLVGCAQIPFCYDFEGPNSLLVKAPLREVSCIWCRPKRSGRGALGYTLMLIMNDILHRDQFHRDFEIIMLLT